MNSPQPAPGPAAPGLTAQGRNWTRRLVNVLVALVVIAVAGATFVFSYAGVHAIALLGGVSAQLARYYPGLFDAVLVIACVAATVLRDGRWWARLWAWVVMIIVLGAIGAADVLHAMNYALQHRQTEGVVAAAPVVAVLLAFSLLLTLLRQSRTQAPPAPVAALVDIPALPAAVSVSPIALPAAPAVPVTSPAFDSPAADAAPPTVPVPVPAPKPVPVSEAKEAPPTVPVPVPEKAPPTVPVPVPEPGRGTVPEEAPGPEDVTAEGAGLGDKVPGDAESEDEDAALEGAVVQEAHTPTKPNEIIPAAAAESDESEPPTVPVAAVTPPPVPPRSQGIRYASGTRNAPPRADYWETEGTLEFAGLVFRAPDNDDDEAPGNGTAARPSPPEFDDDAPPFATAPFASVPRLNRVRSMPTPPEDEDENENENE
jgi:hypothetical protein